MARLLTAGAEEGSRRGMKDIFITSSDNSGTSPDVYTAFSGVVAPYGVVPRTGDCFYGTWSAEYLVASLPTGLTELYVGFAVWVPPFGTSPGGNTSGFYLTNPDCGLQINPSSAQIKAVYNNSGVTIGTASIPLGQWAYVEWHIICSTGSSGTSTVKVNGTQVINVTAARTCQNAGNIDVVRMIGLNNNAQNSWCFWDDIVVNSTSGSSPNNTFPGQVRLFPLRVRAAGDTQNFSRKGVDLGYNQANIREVGSGTSWVEDGTSSDLELAAVDAPQLPAGYSIVQVINDVHCRTQAGGANVTPTIKSSSTVSNGTSTAVPPSWSSIQQTWTTDPATSAAWTNSALSSLQLGAKVG